MQHFEIKKTKCDARHHGSVGERFIGNEEVVSSILTDGI